MGFTEYMDSVVFIEYTGNIVLTKYYTDSVVFTKYYTDSVVFTKCAGSIMFTEYHNRFLSWFVS